MQYLFGSVIAACYTIFRTTQGIAITTKIMLATEIFAVFSLHSTYQTLYCIRLENSSDGKVLRSPKRTSFIKRQINSLRAAHRQKWPGYRGPDAGHAEDGLTCTDA